MNESLSEYSILCGDSSSMGSAEPDGFVYVSHRHVHHPVHILAKASLFYLVALRGITSVDVQRFRPNVADVSKHCCVVLASQPDLREDFDICRVILRHNRRNCRAHCSVKRAGRRRSMQNDERAKAATRAVTSRSRGGATERASAPAAFGGP